MGSINQCDKFSFCQEADRSLVSTINNVTMGCRIPERDVS